MEIQITKEQHNMENEEKIMENNENQEQKETKKDVLSDYRNEDGTLNEDKVIKLSEDRLYYRQKLSKLNQLPSSVEEYGKDFVLDSKFDEYVSSAENKDKIDELLSKIDKMSMEKGIGIERNHDIRRFVLDELVANKVIDLTPAEKKRQQAEQIISERNQAVQESIGEVSDINAWNKNLFDWLKTFCNSDAEFEMHKKLAETNSLWALSLNKIRQAQMGNKIPVIHSDPKFNQEEWDRAFLKASREEQDKMLEERAKELTKGK